MSAQSAQSSSPATSRTLAVVDWSVDAATVAEALRAHADRAPGAIDLLVPSRLPALDWIGDPKASCPCAERQLAEVRGHLRQRGVEVERSRVGEPERVAATRDATEEWEPDRILLLDRPRLVAAHPLGLARRVERSTGRTVLRLEIPLAHGWARGPVRRAPRCATA